jgi:hypothetical protein
MSYIKVFGVAALLVSECGAVYAADCPVEKFTVQDLERLKFSESLALAVVDTMEMSQEQKSQRGFSAGVVIKGVPLNITGNEMKDVSEFVKKNNSLNFSKQQQIDYLRTNLSLVGAKMYEECLKRRTQNFAIEIPTSAYTDDDFAATVRWTPTYSVGKPTGSAEIQVVNGTVDGKQTVDKAVKDKQTVNFIIHRKDRTKSLQIIPRVDGYDNGEDTGILIPPMVSINYTTRLRKWPDASLGEKFTRMCADDGGGICGDQEKHVKKCINASDEGMLLPSTTAIESNMVHAAFANATPESNGSSVCVDFGVKGKSTFGQKGYAALESLAFTVREVVPRK